MFYLLVSYGVVENLNHGITTTLRPQNGGKRIRDACIYPYKINVAQYYP